MNVFKTVKQKRVNTMHFLFNVMHCYKLVCLVVSSGLPNTHDTKSPILLILIKQSYLPPEITSA
jgi:hypothetical protein